MKRGAFIVLEGADAVGKQTQSERLVERFKALGREAKLFAFHRYDTTLGQAIRAHLKEELVFMHPKTPVHFHNIADGRPQGWRPESVSEWSALIFQSMAVVDKYDAAAEIKDLVASGGVVVADRWWQSSYAYGGGDGLPADWLLRVHQFLPQAGLNIYLKLPREVARLRRPVPEDRYEKDEGQQERVRSRYNDLWTDRMVGPKAIQWRILDAVGTVDDVEARIWSTIHEVFGEDLTEGHAP